MLWLLTGLIALFAAVLVLALFAIKLLLAFWLVTLVILPFWAGILFSALIHPLAGLAAAGVMFWGGWQVNRWLMTGGAGRKQDQD